MQAAQTLIQKGLRTLFPPVCFYCDTLGEPVCASCHEDMNVSIHQSSIDGHKHFYFSEYSPQYKSAFHGIKYHHYHSLVDELSQKLLVLTDRLKPQLSNYHYWSPVPYHPFKLYLRGINIVDSLFSPLFQALNIPKRELFSRKKNTRALYSFSRQKRKDILKQSFVLKETIKPYDKILLVDDIVTSRQTMQSLISLLPDDHPQHKISCLSYVKV